MKTIASLIATLLSTLAFACSSSSDSSQDGVMSLSKGCVQTECQAAAEHANHQCEECTSACASASYACDPSSACSDSCSSYTCTDSERNTCAQTGFVVKLPSTPSAGLATACKAFVSHATTCGNQDAPSASDCDRYSYVERPELAQTYGCYAALACGADPSSCSPGTSTLGDDVCGGSNACGSGMCDSIATGLKDALNEEGAWARPDVAAALKTCAAQASCQDVTDCVNAWVLAVL